jgi:hypothetical protein
VTLPPLLAVRGGNHLGQFENMSTAQFVGPLRAYLADQPRLLADQIPHFL